MTIIEFFDKSPLENIAGALLCRPERVIFIGDRRKQIEKSIDMYSRVLSRRGCNISMSYKTVSRNNLANIVSVLESIVADNEDCVFDLTGGEALYLVAVGMIMDKYGSAVQCHLFNFNNSKLIDCDADGIVCNTQPFDMSVEEGIIMHGGEIKRDTELYRAHSDGWEFTDEFCSDVEKMWSICRTNSRLWNSHVGTLSFIDESYGLQDSLEVSFEKQHVVSAMNHTYLKYSLIIGIMQSLERMGLICDFQNGDVISFSYKNDFVKRCLTVSGQILELIVAVKLRRLTDDGGEPLYHDTKVGVMIDWDGYNEDETVRTVNEIDVIAVKDAIPVFISCKNGAFSADELYKLSTVAERFGSQYAKKVLIATELDKLGVKAEYIRARAADMKIRLVENIDEMEDGELDRVLRSLWCN